MSTIPTDMPYLAPGQDPPGRWEPIPEGEIGHGLRHWTGQPDWLTRHGEAVCKWSLGRPRRAWSVLLPDGSRGEAGCVHRLTGLGWRRRVGDHWVFGWVTLSETDAVFADAVEQPVAEIPDDDGTPNLEANLLRSNDVAIAVRDRDVAEALYRALCNVEWRRVDMRPPERWSCSWRHAAGLVADLRGEGEIYTDFYPHVRVLLGHLGWHPLSAEEIAADHDLAMVLLEGMERRPAAPEVPAWYQVVVRIGPDEPLPLLQGDGLRARLHRVGQTGRATEPEWTMLWDAVDWARPSSAERGSEAAALFRGRREARDDQG